MKFAFGSILLVAPLLGACNGSAPVSDVQNPVAAVGADSSGGGDLKSPLDGSAWFLGKDKTVRVCYETGPAFQGRFDLASEISDVFAQWNSYYESKNPTLSVPPNVQVINTNTEPPFPGFALTPEISSANPGGCAAQSPDLTIYFGVDNADTERVQANYDTPVGFAYRTQYSAQDGWGKGFIWLDGEGNGYYFPDELSVHGILLHELGHVLGCEHVSGTIMDANIAWLLRNDGPVQTAADRAVMLSKIDQDRELLMSTAYVYSFSGVGGMTDGDRYSDIRPLFQELMGRPLSGALILRLQQPAVVAANPVLSLGDSQGTKQFQLSPIDSSLYKGDTQIFYAVTLTPTSSSTGVYNQYGAGGAVPNTQRFSLVLEGGQTLEMDAVWNEDYNRGIYAPGQSTRDMSGFSPVRVNFYQGAGAASGAIFLQTTNWI